MIFVIIMVLLSIGGALAHLVLSKEPRTTERISEIFFLYLTVVCFGLNGLWGFAGHFFVPDLVASQIGWTKGSPFQTEVAFANLALGITSLLNIWIRENYWIATTIYSTIFLGCAGCLHIQEMIAQNNFAIGNTLILLTDIVVPIIVIILLILHAKIGSQTKKRIA